MLWLPWAGRVSDSGTKSTSLPLVPAEARQICRRALPSVSSSVCPVTTQSREGKRSTHRKSAVFKLTHSCLHLSRELNSLPCILGGNSGIWLRWLYCEGQNSGHHSSCEYPAQIFASKAQGWADRAMAFLSAGIFLVASPGGYLQPLLFFCGLSNSSEVGAFCGKDGAGNEVCGKASSTETRGER